MGPGMTTGGRQPSLLRGAPPRGHHTRRSSLLTQPCRSCLEACHSPPGAKKGVLPAPQAASCRPESVRPEAQGSCLLAPSSGSQHAHHLLVSMQTPRSTCLSRRGAHGFWPGFHSTLLCVFSSKIERTGTISQNLPGLLGLVLVIGETLH